MFVIHRKMLFLFAVILVIATAVSFGMACSVKSVFGGVGVPCVIIDAGHGEPDGGAVGVSGVKEKDINLAIAQKTEEVLAAKGIKVIMTRTGDFGLSENKNDTLKNQKREDMNTRLSIMKNSGADLFLSIHMNSFKNDRANGLHIFYAENHEEIKPLAENIQSRIAQITGAKAHTVKTAEKSLFLMKNPPIPAILAECGFISNPEEERKLCNEEYRSKIAWAIAEAVEEYYEF